MSSFPSNFRSKSTSRSDYSSGLTRPNVFSSSHPRTTAITNLIDRCIGRPLTAVRHILGGRLPVNQLQRTYHHIRARFYRTLKRNLPPLAYKTIVRYRLPNLALALLMIFTLAIPLANKYLDYQLQPRYILSSSAKSIVGDSTKSLTNKLTYDDQKQLFQFNKEGKAVTSNQQPATSK